MKRLTAIAMSGGIDSTVAAYLLLKEGHSVIGIHFIHNSEFGKQADPAAVTKPENPDATSSRVSKLAKQLGIPLKIYDLSTIFRHEVINYFIAAYEKGLTPNPCMVCNPLIKFGALLDFAGKLGSEYLATGHYARIQEDTSGRFRLFRGADRDKDQSYFLALVNSKQLARAMFPLGSLTKATVKQIAKEQGFTSDTIRESQDICFIKGMTYSEFISCQPGFTPQPGLIEDVNGNIIGKHNGLHLFTIGQRRGINCPASEPYYVLHIDKPENRLVVGFKSELDASRCFVTDINWISEIPPSPLKLKTQIRYRHQAAPSTLTLLDEKTAIVEFDQPENALTPGQAAVFYQGNEVLGGGWISNQHFNFKS